MICAGRQGGFAELPIVVPDAAIEVRGILLQCLCSQRVQKSQAMREGRGRVLQRASRLRETGDGEVSRCSRASHAAAVDASGL